jgi:hypothetical protein
MALKIWRGDGPAVAQVDTLTVATATAADVYTVTINGNKIVTYTVPVSPSDAAVAAAIAALLQACDFPEFREITWDYPGTGAVITATASTTGVPVVFTTAVTGTGTFAKSPVTANSGPAVSASYNWSAAGTPGAADDVTFAKANNPCRYFTDDLTGTTLGTVKILAGEIGLPDDNDGGYAEYRTKAFDVGGAASYQIGDGTGGPSFCRLNARGTADPITVNTGAAFTSTGSGPPIRITTATSAGHFLTVVSGSVGVAYGPGEIADFATVTVGTSGVDGSAGATDEEAQVIVGSGAVVAALTQNGGSVRTDAGITTITLADGTFTITAGGTTTLTCTGGTVVWNSSSALGTQTYTGPNAILDLSGASSALSLTGLTFTQGARLIDPNRRLAGRSVTFDAASLRATLEPSAGAVESGNFTLGF